jgi:hypothetical protein
MEDIHNSNTSEDIIPDGLMELTKEAVSGIFEKINTERGMYDNNNMQSNNMQKNVNIQSVPEVIQILKNEPIKQPKVAPPFNTNVQSILKHSKPVQEPSVLAIEPSVLATEQPVIINTQYMKIINFEIAHSTLYFAFGLVILIGIYYYMQHRNNTQKEEKNTKIRRGIRNDNKQYNEQYEE